MSFSPEEASSCKHLVELGLAEDLVRRAGSQPEGCGYGGREFQRGDITSEAVIPAGFHGRAGFVARSPGVVAGLPAIILVAEAVDPRLAVSLLVEDGRAVDRGGRLAEIAGPMRGILAAERTALNFLQHLSGIATLTRRFVDAVAGCNVRILDTRKTIPGWRLLAKYAVRQGGGHNHRVGLYDGVLIKDNHLRGLQIADWRLQIEKAVALARQKVGVVPVEIEVESLKQLDVALACKPDIVLLDNMTPAQLRQAVERRRQLGCSAKLEASGGVTLDNVRTIAETGVDRISIGALTHSAPALDIALDYDA